MMEMGVRIIFFVFSFCSLGPIILRAYLKVLTEDFAPFNYVENDMITGFTVEIVEELIKKAGVSIERGKILLWPWKRAYLRCKGK